MSKYTLQSLDRLFTFYSYNAITTKLIWKFFYQYCNLKLYYYRYCLARNSFVLKFRRINDTSQRTVNRFYHQWGNDLIKSFLIFLHNTLGKHNKASKHLQRDTWSTNHYLYESDWLTYMHQIWFKSSRSFASWTIDRRNKHRWSCLINSGKMKRVWKGEENSRRRRRNEKIVRWFESWWKTFQKRYKGWKRERERAYPLIERQEESAGNRPRAMWLVQSTS